MYTSATGKKRNPKPAGSLFTFFTGHGTWIQATSPQSLAYRAFEVWSETAKKDGCVRMGWVQAEVPTIRNNDSQCTEADYRSLFLHFPTSEQATAWRKRIETSVDPFWSSIVKNPSKDPRWREGKPRAEPPEGCDYSCPPEGVLQVGRHNALSQSEATELIDRLDLLGVASFMDEDSGFVWIPVRTLQDGASFPRSYLQGPPGDTTPPLQARLIDIRSFHGSPARVNVTMHAAGDQVYELICCLFKSRILAVSRDNERPNTWLQIEFLDLASAIECMMAWASHTANNEHLFWALQSRPRAGSASAPAIPQSSPSPAPEEDLTLQPPLEKRKRCSTKLAWVFATVPVSLARDLFSVWRQYLDPQWMVGHCSHELNNAPDQDLGFFLTGSIRLYIQFPSLTRAKQWIKVQAIEPVKVDLLADQVYPTTRKGWAEGIPEVDERNRPMALLRVRTIRGASNSVKRMSWIHALSQHHIAAFENYGDGCVYVPVSKVEVAYNLKDALWDSGFLLCPDTTAQVVVLGDRLVRVGAFAPDPAVCEGLHQYLQILYPHALPPRSQPADPAPVGCALLHFLNAADALKCMVSWKQHRFGGNQIRWVILDTLNPSGEEVPFDEVPADDVAVTLRAPPRASRKNLAQDNQFPLETGAEAETVDLPVWSEDSARRAQLQAEGAKTEWVEMRLDELPPLPQPRPDEIPRTPEEVLDDIRRWSDQHHRPYPSETVIERVLRPFSDDPARLLAFERARLGLGNPLEFLAALSNGQTVDANGAVLYVLMLQVTVSGAEKALERIQNITNAQRQRIVWEIRKIIERLKREHPGQPNFVFWLVYVGMTENLLRRPGFDLIDLIHSGDKEDDKRPPMKVMMDVGAGVSSKSDMGVVGLKQGTPIVYGDPEVIKHGLPKSLRIPIVSLEGEDEEMLHDGEPTLIGYFNSAQLNVAPGGQMDYAVPIWLVNELAPYLVRLQEPLKHIHFIGDARGSLDTPFEECRTGCLFMNIFRSLLPGRLLSLQLTNWHAAVAHPSNIEETTPDEVKATKSAIKHDIFLVFMGTVVSLYNAYKHLFARSEVVLNAPFFTLLTVVWEGTEILIMVMPYPGVHNYIGTLQWTMEAFSYGQALMLLVAAALNQLDASVPRTKLVQNTLTSLHAMPLVKKLTRILAQRGNRSAWNGRVAVKISNRLMEGDDFERALYESICLNHHLITSFLPPTPMQPREEQVVVLPPKEGKDSESWVYLSCLVPVVPGSRNLAPLIRPLCIDAHWRTAEQVEGHLYLDDTLALVFQCLDGRVHVADGVPFILNRWQWRTSLTLGALDSLLENHCKLQGRWTTPGVFEERIVSAYMPRFVGGKLAKDRYLIRADSNLINTFDKDKILEGVRDGQIQLASLGKNKMCFRVWKPSIGQFEPLHEEVMDIKFLYRDGLGDATHFAISHLFKRRLWIFMLFRVSEETQWKPQYLQNHATTFHSDHDKGRYLVKHGEATELFQAEQGGDIGAINTPNNTAPVSWTYMAPSSLQ